MQPARGAASPAQLAQRDVEQSGSTPGPSARAGGSGPPSAHPLSHFNALPKAQSGPRAHLSRSAEGAGASAACVAGSKGQPATRPQPPTRNKPQSVANPVMFDTLPGTQGSSTPQHRRPAHFAEVVVDAQEAGGGKGARSSKTGTMSASEAKLMQEFEQAAAAHRAHKEALAGVVIVNGSQWKYYLFFLIKALVLIGTMAMVLVNCAWGPPPDQRQFTDSQAISVAGQTCQVNPSLDAWWPGLVGIGVLQLVWAVGAGVYFLCTGWYPRDAAQVYLLQAPVSTASVISAGVGLAGGGWLILVLSWVVVSFMSGFAVVLGLLPGVPGLWGDTDKESSCETPTTPIVQASGTAPSFTPDEGTGVADMLDDAEAGRDSAEPSSKPGLWNPYEVTVQQYGRWYALMLLLFEFNKIGDISTALTLGVGEPEDVVFFVLAAISIAHVQVTFYWLVGTRTEAVCVDLYRGMGDLVIDTPMLIIELIKLAEGMGQGDPPAVLIFATVLKCLSTVVHVWGLVKDLQLFAEERAQRQLAVVRGRVVKRLSIGMRKVAAVAHFLDVPEGSPHPSVDTAGESKALKVAPLSSRWSPRTALPPLARQHTVKVATPRHGQAD